jgi:hypothetical protein
MASRPGSHLETGITEVAETGKPVKLTSTVPSGISLGILVQCDPSNTGSQCVIGDKNVVAKKTLGETRGIVLETKQIPVRIEISDPTQLYVDAAASKDRVIWTAIVG